ncbi:glutathione S-transferase [Cognatiyoonia sediminum]|uniref:Glutathione S-transferase n=1 Tax=Cognatiyoonia sediminum TaxID=1508389 RepID=A0A1M5NNR5_9RHOB|nr:glutathione S-transferase family protein [Cognatiyoonia sediminum]SHG90573.1 glutathione S-transferase [Cognatiyoonia sediminum]
MGVALIGYPVSPFVRKVRVALETKGISYTLDPIVPYTEREKVLTVNPAGTVPVLIPGESAAPITESADVVAWSDQTVPSPAIIPKDPQLRARALDVQRFADGQMAQVFGGMMFGQRIVVPYYFGKAQGKEDMVQNAITQLAPPLLDTVANLIGDESFVARDFSVADIAMASWLRGARLAGFQLDEARWPMVAQWLGRCFDQPGFASVIASEEKTEVVRWARARYAA